jgi:hypothetical protein
VRVLLRTATIVSPPSLLVPLCKGGREGGACRVRGLIFAPMDWMPPANPQSFSIVVTSDCVPSRQVMRRLIDLVVVGTFI